MMHSSETFLENPFFAVQFAGEMEDVSHWDLIRKLPTLPGSTSDLLEVLAPVLLSGTYLRILIPASDHYLCRDLQTVGLRLRGYLTEDFKSGSLLNLMDGSEKLSFLSVAALSDHDIGALKFVRVVLETSDNLVHNLAYEDDIYFEFCFRRERILTGITEHSYLPSEQKVTLAAKKTSIAPRRLSQFNNVVSERKSVSRLSPATRTSFSLLESVLIDCYYRRSDGHLPYGTAGGFDNMKLHIVVEQMEGIEDGFYSIHSDGSTWDKRDVGLTRSLMHQICLSQDQLRACTAWLILSADLNEISEKYGSRSLRFSYIHTGSLLQQLHLSCTSYGVGFKSIGGFDDGLISSILGFNPSRNIVTAIACIGDLEP